VPIYAYDCERCGGFDLHRPVTEASAPAACPECSLQARRRFTAPGVALLARPLRRAMDREEASAHEPEVTSVKRGRPMPHRHAHGHGHAPPWVMSH
jgi:putative FmdB family regulatory protein